MELGLRVEKSLKKKSEIKELKEKKRREKRRNVRNRKKNTEGQIEGLSVGGQKSSSPTPAQSPSYLSLVQEDSGS